MSLTTGRGPLSGNPIGRFRPSLPDDLVYVEPCRRRVRGLINGEAVVDSERVLLVHRAGQPSTYAFPTADVTGVSSEPEREADGYVRVAWDAVDLWLEEDEPVIGHPRSPYHRIDCLHSSRRLRVAVNDVELVDTTDTMALYETALDPRLYVDRRHVRMDLLRPSATKTHCPYKGFTIYWTFESDGVVVEDVAWSYDDPLPESLPIKGMLSFELSRAEVTADLPPAAEL